MSVRLRGGALPHLLTLYEATGENVHLAILAGTEALYIARLTRTGTRTRTRTNCGDPGSLPRVPARHAARARKTPQLRGAREPHR